MHKIYAFGVDGVFVVKEKFKDQNNYLRALINTKEKMEKQQFFTTMGNSWSFKGNTILLGSAIYCDEEKTGIQLKLPLKTINRHGLIAGATGTGKTKSLQVIAENLSQAGVPVLVMDIKGDLSGLGAAGVTNPVIEKRKDIIGMDWEGKRYPLEFLSISEEPGARLRATVSEYGPVLLSKILGLNDNQAGVLSMIFKFCDDRNLPLLDMKDLKSVIGFLQDEGREEFQKEYGFVHSSSAGIIMRSIITLEQQGADELFGEPSFDVFDLMKTDSDGLGVINVLRLTDMQDKPGLFSTFMLCLLAEIFQNMPEAGDPEKPKLVLFIDEAHLIFKNASQSLIDQLEMTVKLIRSKGVGLFFVTQSPNDIPAAILGQLGTKVQHALRAFTAKDRKEIKSASENFPYSGFYKTDELITQLGIGEALVSTLDEKGRPTELAHCMMCPPTSRMDVLTDAEISRIVQNSALTAKYNLVIDRQSAHEILHDRITRKTDEEEEERELLQERSQKKKSREEPGTFEKIMKSPVTHMIAREVTRGLLGVLGLKAGTTSRSRYSSTTSRSRRR